MQRKEVDREEFEHVREGLSNVVETICNHMTIVEGCNEDHGRTILIRQADRFFVDADGIPHQAKAEIVPPTQHDPIRKVRVYLSEHAGCWRQPIERNGQDANQPGRARRRLTDLLTALEAAYGPRGCQEPKGCVNLKTMYANHTFDAFEGGKRCVSKPFF